MGTMRNAWLTLMPVGEKRNGRYRTRRGREPCRGRAAASMNGTRRDRAYPTPLRLNVAHKNPQFILQQKARSVILGKNQISPFYPWTHTYRPYSEVLRHFPCQVGGVHFTGRARNVNSFERPRLTLPLLPHSFCLHGCDTISIARTGKLTRLRRVGREEARAPRIWNARNVNSARVSRCLRCARSLHGKHASVRRDPGAQRRAALQVIVKKSLAATLADDAPEALKLLRGLIRCRFSRAATVRERFLRHVPALPNGRGS